MSKLKRPWERLSEEEVIQAKEDIMVFFENERDEKIGLIAAGNLLDFFQQHIGGKLYNKGLRDAQQAMDKRIQELKYDIDDLVDLD